MGRWVQKSLVLRLKRLILIWIFFLTHSNCIIICWVTYSGYQRLLVQNKVSSGLMVHNMSPSRWMAFVRQPWSSCTPAMKSWYTAELLGPLPFSKWWPPLKKIQSATDGIFHQNIAVLQFLMKCHNDFLSFPVYLTGGESDRQWGRMPFETMNQRQGQNRTLESDFPLTLINF